VLRVEVVAALVDVAEAYGRTDFDRAAVGFFLAGEDLEQRRLTRAIGADDADDAARGQGEAEVFEQQLFAIGLGDALGQLTICQIVLGHNIV